LMHPFWRESDAQSRTMEQVQFLKDLGLAGAAIYGLAAVWLLGDDLGLTITGPLFAS
ncbi:MAG: DoxX family protein, partial [Gammaproteobacteria bacterium]|nr:DoxX family protein [Gemmatimonadota bacterium]NIS35334.1 DoxX family protein [Actinomycetota bacterium]NIU78576.1 DoxX family protein [Gammaproteobacteria bacterium]